MAEAVGLGIKTPDAFGTLGSMLNFANTAQNIQRGNIELQQNEIKLKERQAIQNLFRNPDQFKGADGLPDYDKMISMGMAAAPTTFPTMVPQIIQAKKEAIGAQQAFNSLNKEGMQAVGQYFGSLKGQDAKTIDAMVTSLGNQNPQLKPWIAIARRNMIDPALDSKDQKRIDAATENIAQWALSRPEQIAAQTPQGVPVSTGQYSYSVNVKPTAGDVGSVIPGTVAEQELPPGQQEKVIQDAFGRSFVQRMDRKGNIIETRALPGASASASPGQAGPGFINPAPGQKEDVPIVARERADINNAASQVPTQRFNNDQILSVLKNSGTSFALTGPGAESMANLAARIGVPWSGGRAEDYQNLGHYLALQAQSNAKAMGAGTDAAREVSALASGDRTMTPQALMKIAKTNNAFATGLEAMNQGMERAINAAGGNVLAARDFRNEWAKAFDPNGMRIINAIKANDQEEIADVIKSVGGKNSKGMKELRDKVRKMDSLLTNGRL